MGEKVYMLNVLWFKEDGGEAKYAEDATAAAPFVDALGAKLVESYTPELALIGEWNPDLIFVVEWPDWKSFTQLPQNAGYLKIAHLREEALADSLLIRCRKGEVPLPQRGSEPNSFTRPSQPAATRATTATRSTIITLRSWSFTGACHRHSRGAGARCSSSRRR